MNEPKNVPTLSREERLALVVELQRQIAELRASHEALRAEIEQLKGGGKRRPPRFPGVLG
jgi:cell division protein FtsB